MDLDSNPYPRSVHRRAQAWEDGYLDHNREDGAHKWATPLLGYVAASVGYSEEDYWHARGKEK